MQAIQQDRQTSVAASPHLQKQRWRNIALIGVGVAVVGVVLGQFQQWLSPPGLSTAQLVELELFMVGSWDEAVDPNAPLADWDLVSADSQQATPIAAANLPFPVDSEP